MAALSARRQGGGRPVVLLPSLGRPGSDLAVLADAAARRGWEAVTVDLHGVGASPALPAGADLHTAAADVADLIGPTGGGLGPGGAVGPAVLVGHAFGNRVARCVAADHPDLIGGLILLGCGGRIPGDDEARAALHSCFDADLGMEEHLAAVATAFFAPGADPSVWRDGWWPAAARAQAAAGAATPVEEWWLPPAPIKVLAVVGAEDRISPPANALALVGALGGRGELLVVPGAGHALVPERPREVVAAVTGFLDRLAG